LRPIERLTDQGVVTPIDPLGQRVVFLVRSVPGSASIYQAALSDTEGILRLERLGGRRRDARNFVRELRERAKGRAVIVPGAAVRALVRQAQEIPRSRLPGEVDPTLIRELTASGADTTPGETLRAELADEAGGLAEAWAESVIQQRIQRGELPVWPLTGDSVREIAEKLEGIKNSHLVLSPAIQRERSDALLARAADEWLTPEVRERFARRLEETGVFFLESADREGALAAVHMAERIRTTPAPLAVGYLRTLLELSCGQARQQKREEDRGRLIVPG
jgi:hypothetical protein